MDNACAGHTESEWNDALLRYTENHRDISQRMLTVTLRSLETDGLIVRKVYAEVPPRVEYNLTEIGCSLMPHIESLVGWALEHMNDILNRRSLQN